MAKPDPSAALPFPAPPPSSRRRLVRLAERARRCAAGLLAISAACLAVGGYSALSTQRFLAKAVRARATIFYADGSESNTVLVEVRGPTGAVQRRLPVRIAWWSPPWSYLRGEEVAIAYDPRGRYDVPLLGDSGRVDSWGQLWSGSVLWSAAGLLAAGLWGLTRFGRVRVRVALGIGLENGGRQG